ncbi:hypothetical protein [Mesorhizobium sp. M0040]|uniref:hypothetical protein n=1 Tax=Mesorhizobium sp. M0040 TaxID=2956855 RepID=UPI00333D284F
MASFIMSPFNIEFGIGVLLALSIRKWKPNFTFSGQILSLILLSLAIRAFVVHFGLEIRTLTMVLSIAPLLVVTMLVAVGTRTTPESRVGLALGDASYSISLPSAMHARHSFDPGQDHALAAIECGRDDQFAGRDRSRLPRAYCC